MKGTKVKKRTLSGVGAALVLAVVCVLVCFHGFSLQVHAEATGKVTAKSAYVRQSADKNSDVVAGLLQGDTFTINGQTTGADGKIWYQVFVNSEQLGYIRSDLVEKTGDAPTIAAGNTSSGTSSGGMSNPSGSGNGGNASSPADDTVTAQITRLNPVSATVKGASVNVRKNCTTKSSVVTSIPKGTVITVNGQATGADGKIWYQVSFISNNEEVTGFIHSNYVTLSEDPTPYVEPEPTEPEPDVGADDPQPEQPVQTPKEWDTAEEEGVWKMTQYSTGKTYDIVQLLTLSTENAEKLKDANASVKSQKIVIIVLVVILVILALVIAICIFRFKDIILDEAFGGREDPPVKRRPSGSQSRPAGTRPAGSQGQRPASSGQGQRSASSGQGQRPASSGQGQRPASSGQGQRPASSGQGQRPAASGQGQRPVSTGQSQRTASSGQSGRPSAGRPSGASRQGVDAISTSFDMTDIQQGEERVRRETARSLEEQQIRRSTVSGSEGKSTRKSRNFMTDEDGLEYEFLNRDGERE